MSKNYTGFIRLAAIAALIIVGIYLIELVVVLVYGLPPYSVEAWFTLFETHRLIGLVQSFALDIVAVFMHAPLFIGLYLVLKDTKKSSGTLILATLLSFIGIAVYFSTNTTFSMLFLSDQYAAATSETQKTQLLTSGQTLFSIYNGTGPFAAYFLYALAGILISVVMFHHPFFSKSIAITGIIGNALELGLPPSLDPAFFLKIDPYLIGIGGVFLLFWYTAIAIKLFNIAKHPIE